jgi:hypothetical protein
MKKAKLGFRFFQKAFISQNRLKIYGISATRKILAAILKMFAILDNHKARGLSYLK